MDRIANVEVRSDALWPLMAEVQVTVPQRELPLSSQVAKGWHRPEAAALDRQLRAHHLRSQGVDSVVRDECVAIANFVSKVRMAQRRSPSIPRAVGYQGPRNP